MPSRLSPGASARTAPDEQRPALPPLARLPVLSAMVSVAVVLVATSGGYGYERDELYFRMLEPGWGYLDQPPLTPLLARAAREVLTDAVWALRLPALLAALASVWLVVAVTRELGGGRRAQTLAAWGYAFASFPLVLGHTLLTTTIDEPVWLAVLLFVLRAQLREDARWWPAAGVVIGLGLYNKLLIVVLLAALVGGVLVAGPRRLLLSRPVLGAAAVALVVGSPNVIYQVVNGWPQLEFGRQLSAHNAADVRTSMWPMLLLLLGPPLTVVWISGLVALWRRPQWRAVRFLAAAFPVLLVLVFVLGSQAYYPFGLVGGLYAVGCVPAAEWLGRGGSWRIPALVVAVAVNAAVSAVIALPLVPVGHLGDTPIPSIDMVVGDSVGWPAYVDEVARVYRSVPIAERPHTVLVASNYGEAGALDRFGPGRGLPRVYSAQNQLYAQARPPARATVAVFVGGQLPDARTLFASCTTSGHLDDRVGVDNEEQGEPIGVCRSPRGGWSRVWPLLKHED